VLIWHAGRQDHAHASLPGHSDQVRQVGGKAHAAPHSAQVTGPPWPTPSVLCDARQRCRQQCTRRDWAASMRQAPGLVRACALVAAACWHHVLISPGDVGQTRLFVVRAGHGKARGHGWKRCGPCSGSAGAGHRSRVPPRPQGLALRWGGRRMGRPCCGSCGGCCPEPGTGAGRSPRRGVAASYGGGCCGCCGGRGRRRRVGRPCCPEPGTGAGRSCCSSGLGRGRRACLLLLLLGRASCSWCCSWGLPPAPAPGACSKSSSLHQGELLCTRAFAHEVRWGPARCGFVPVLLHGAKRALVPVPTAGMPSPRAWDSHNACRQPAQPLHGPLGATDHARPACRSPTGVATARTIAALAVARRNTFLLAVAPAAAS
jgi:hypothetical protein